MTWIAECDGEGCGQCAKAPPTPGNMGPPNPTTDGVQWWSRKDRRTGETYHACSPKCRENQPNQPKKKKKKKRKRSKIPPMVSDDA